MTQISTLHSGPSGLATVPLAVAYGAVPLGTAAAQYLSGPSGPVSVFLPWLLLACIGTVIAMLRPSPGAPKSRGFLFQLTLFLLMIAGVVMYGADVVSALSPYMPMLQEVSPLVFMLFCCLWVATCGLPDRADFQRFGGLLGVICLVDLIAEVVIYQAAPTVRWIGNTDILAGLLIVAICAGLKPGENEGGIEEPDQGNTVWRLLALLGLLACMSRTGLFAAAWVVLCFGRGRVLFRILFVVACIALLALTFFIPSTASDAVRYADYWLWMEAMRLAMADPLIMLTGFPLDAPLPIEFPVGMGPIWEAATGTPSMFGVFLSQVPSFWLRLSLAWGLLTPVTLLVVLFVLLFRRLSRMGAGLVAALFAQGMSTPLLYDPAMAAAIGLGFILALTGPMRKTNAKRKEEVETKPDSEPEPHPDPTEEWNLRPL